MEHQIKKRFRGFLPVVVDVETGGFNPQKDALLEVAAVFIDFDEKGFLQPVRTLHYHVKPFPNANIEPEALKINGIDPNHPLRPAWTEQQVAEKLFAEVNVALKEKDCSKAILVGHNATFDLSFIQALANRTNHSKYPFHAFSVLDTVSLGALAYGQTVLARVASSAGLEYDKEKAHGAKYDTELTAQLFCHIFNLWGEKIGWGEK